MFRGKLEPIRSKQIIKKHFTSDEMNLILGDKLISESLAINKPERYWVTLLSAYSGARLNEICQLNVDDIQQANGIWLLSINTNTEDKNIIAPTVGLPNTAFPMASLPAITFLGFE